MFISSEVERFLDCCVCVHTFIRVTSVTWTHTHIYVDGGKRGRGIGSMSALRLMTSWDVYERVTIVSWCYANECRNDNM